jgi:hypothetical protein
VRPEQLSVSARNGKPEKNQLPGELVRAVETPRGMRLEFSNGIAVALPHAEYGPLRDSRNWVIHFPSESLRVL